RHDGRRGGGAGKPQEVTTSELHRVLLRTRSFACACSQHRQKKSVGLLRLRCPPTAPALPVCAHRDLGTSRLRAAEADVTRALVHVKRRRAPQIISFAPTERRATISPSAARSWSTRDRGRRHP